MSFWRYFQGLSHGCTYDLVAYLVSELHVEGNKKNILEPLNPIGEILETLWKKEERKEKNRKETKKMIWASRQHK